MAELFGSCACERNQYTIIIPSTSPTLAQVFFDNSIANRRTQASPVTAWLRIPLDWYHSTTYSFFPDETHNSIRRTFHTPAVQSALPPTRRQFCGYCGTHLTAWNEVEYQSAGYLDVTLGSLLNESMEKLEALDIIQATADEDEGLVLGGEVDDEDHIPTSGEGMEGLEGPPTGVATAQQSGGQSLDPLRNRGMPYFEDIVKNTRLGRLHRQKGGHTSRDGMTSVQWEVVEIDNSELSMEESASESRSKRRKTGS